MNGPYGVVGSVAYGLKTATAGTIIQQLIRPFRKAYTKVTGWKYTAAGTAHVATIRMAIGTTTLSAAAATGQAVVNLTAQPSAARNVAANDYLVIERQEASSGYAIDTWDLVKVSSVVGLAITLTANVPGAYKAGSKVWLMSIDTDTVPGFNTTNPKFTLAASASTELPANPSIGWAGMAGSWNRNEPLIWESNNGTAAGTLEYLAALGAAFAAARE